MVAQQIKTLDLPASVEQLQKTTTRSAIGMVHSDKFSSRIQPFINSRERNETPLYLPKVKNQLNNTDLKFLGVRSQSMCNPAQSTYSRMRATDHSKTFDHSYMNATATTNGKKMLLTLTKEEAYRVAS